MGETLYRIESAKINDFFVKYFFMETLKTRHRFIRVPVVGRRLWYCGAVVVVRSEIVCPVVRREERGEGGSLLPVWSHCSVTEEQPGQNQGWSWDLISLTTIMVR